MEKNHVLSVKAYMRKGNQIRLILEFSKIYLFPHIKYLLKYKYFDGRGKRIYRGVKGWRRS